MFAPPAELATADVVDGLAEGWGLDATSCEYAPLGFGSHHWIVVTGDGRRWFPTVHDLEAKRRSDAEDVGAVWERLQAALQTARSLADHGAAYVVAPVPARDGAVTRLLRSRFALSLYPYVTGRSWTWGGYESASQRRDVLDLVVALHAASGEVGCEAGTDDFAIPRRDGLLEAIDDLAVRWDGGAYSERTRRLLDRHAADVVRVLEHHDRLAAAARRSPERLVLTHGEPHIGNVMAVGGRLVLIDWDTSLLGPPERDLWMIDAGDGAITDAYTAATARPVLPEAMGLYRVGWGLAEVALYVTELRGAHVEDRNTQESWENLGVYIGEVAAT